MTASCLVDTHAPLSGRHRHAVNASDDRRQAEHGDSRANERSTDSKAKRGEAGSERNQLSPAPRHGHVVILRRGFLVGRDASFSPGSDRGRSGWVASSMPQPSSVRADRG